MAEKYVYLFYEGKASMKNLLGGKGANLAEMTNIGMPVPPGFTITTEACTKYYEDDETISDSIKLEILQYIRRLELKSNKQFGSNENPLLVSVRSGARASMPGMMDTILNLGLNDEVVESFAIKTGNPRFAYDSYRRFIQMYSDVVMEVGKSYFEKVIDEMKDARGVELDTELTAEDLKELAEKFKVEYKDKTGEDFPQDPIDQLFGAIEAVFRSWENPRAQYYRRMNDIPSSWGTAVNVQSMVFGNMGDTSGTGVAFSRNPSTGEKGLFGEFLMNAQGEDVVAGIRTPEPIEVLKDINSAVYSQFATIVETLEQHYRDMQDMEFTIEEGKLFMLQTRNGKRTADAALRIAVDLYDEGMISEKEAVMMLDPKQLDALLHPQFDPKQLKISTPIGNGLPASPGAATGQVTFTAEDATAWAKAGKNVILVRLETSPEDIEGMNYAEGILTARGGMTSHAAVVARGMGTCCVAGVSDLKIAEDGKSFQLGGQTVNEGDFISLNGSTGEVYGESISTVPAKITGDFSRLMDWADKYRTLQIRTNADTPNDAVQARTFGAQGIGLCRTEHMFFEADRISAIRQMILSETVEQRTEALAKIEPYQRKDFEELYEAMIGMPVTIRLLDPPLHEFLPTNPEDIKLMAENLGVSVEDVEYTISTLHEFNPMLGHRGVRLDITYPEIAKMQTQAIINAAVTVKKNHPDWPVRPEIMVPLVGDVAELKFVKKVIKETAESIIEESGLEIDYQIGTMIEIPRAALTAAAIAEEADFFSFGTNDLTQMTYGLSRDDAGKFLDAYYDKKIYEADPFAHLDQTGVGRLMEIAIADARTVKPAIKLGICGEHGGDPRSVEFCYHLGLDYVSCSPYRVPIARLAAAQAALNEAGN
ncbi:MAG: pyruvate, phosphate dikinase [Clostridiales Family XIII bacterium]|jgi:pyruvate,orthophosphate dikinase|nr:pyruvate, phosphate dikinase [Clostridiales Family XIII bacterium]